MPQPRHLTMTESASPPSAVLVVDDNDAGRFVKTHSCGAPASAVFEAATGRGALEALSRQPSIWWCSTSTCRT